MGFCIFNSTAVAAQYARAVLGLERVAILDWDVHHGNGTQEIFEKDPNVLFLSVHKGGNFYPGTCSLSLSRRAFVTHSNRNWKGTRSR